MGLCTNKMEYIGGSMSKIAFIFPGQGAQYIGMAKEIAEEYSEAADIFKAASDALGYSMEEMVFEGSEEALMLTENTQPAILTASIACLQPLLLNGIKPAFVAGLSLGEYSAHVAAGSVDFKDAVALVRKRGKYMQEAVPAGVGAMAAILGMENEAVENCCREAASVGFVEPANYNCPGQLVVAGEAAAVDKVIELAKANGARRALLLQVSAPFHCKLLEPAAIKLEKELEGFEVKEMQVPVVTNVTGRVVASSEEIKKLLRNQVMNPVKWEQSVRTMLEEGVDTFVEIGPGKALSGFIKKIDKNARIFNVENLESLKSTLEGLKGFES